MDEKKKEFAKAMLIRAARTFCQAAVATIGTATMIGQVNWTATLSTATLAAVVSVLMSVGTGLPEVK